MGDFDLLDSFYGLEELLCIFEHKVNDRQHNIRFEIKIPEINISNEGLSDIYPTYPTFSLLTHSKHLY